MSQYICYICEKPIVDGSYHIDTHYLVHDKDNKLEPPINMYRHMPECESEQVNKRVVLEVARRGL